jgi:hypothetical protein
MQVKHRVAGRTTIRVDHGRKGVDVGLGEAAKIHDESPIGYKKILKIDDLNKSLSLRLSWEFSTVNRNLPCDRFHVSESALYHTHFQ